MAQVNVLDIIEEEETIIEGQVAEEDIASVADEDASDVEVDDETESTLDVATVDDGGLINEDVAGMLSLEELIKNHIESMEKLRVELKKNREMLDDSFNNNPTYREHVEKVKEVTKGKNSVKQQIAKQPSVALLDQKVKDLRFDINEKNKTLSDLLQDYKEQTGATSIETRNGQVLEIVSTSKLVKK